MNLQILSGGAAQGLVKKLEPLLVKSAGVGVEGSFGAVGAMKEKFAAGTPCDLLVLTEAMIGDLARAGEVIGDTCAAVGRVRTGVAVKDGVAFPPIHDGDSLRRALADSTGIYFPDPQLATAGIHVMKVLRALGMEQELAGRLRPYPNGATAMREMAAIQDKRAIGCTQVTEILMTPGVKLVGPLPKDFELVTVYSVAVAKRAAQPDQARAFAQLLTAPQSADARTACGFE